MDKKQRKILQIEEFVNEKLKRDLREYEEKLDSKNSDIAELLQLKSIIDTFKTTEAAKNGFKTKVDLGCNFFLQAKVENASNILLNVGLDHFVEFSLDEALVIIGIRIKLLESQISNLRKHISFTNSSIKCSLLALGQLQKI